MRTDKEVPQKYIWEGKILNKISKKIVSLVTAAAFALTLVPAAAFAAGSADLDNSTFTVAENTLSANESVRVTLDVNDSTGAPVNLENARIWVTPEGSDDVVVNAAIYSTTVGDWNSYIKDGVFGLAKAAALKSDESFSVAIPAVGDYDIHVGQAQTQPDGSTKVVEINSNGNVNVNEVVNRVNLAAPAGDNVFVAPDGTMANYYDLVYNEDSTTVVLDKANLLPNSIIEYTLTGTAYTGFVHGSSYGNVVAGETFNVTSNSDNLIVSDDTVTTKADGTFDLSFKVAKAGNYKITLHNSDVNYTINVTYKTANDDIQTVVSNGETLLAGTDTKNYVGNNKPANYAAAIKFEITNNEGGIVTGANAIANEPAAKANANNHSKFVEVVSAPEGSKLAASDIELVDAGEYYTVKYVGNDAAHDLIPGEYSIKISLANGEYAVANMTFANYGTTQDVVLDMTATTIKAPGESVQTETITNQVKLGRHVEVQAKYVDENGVKINAQDAVYGFDGKAVDTYTATTFNTKPNVAYNETYIGSTITVTAVDKDAKKIATTELTVVDAYSENTLEFDSETGLVDTDNTVTVSVVDADGNVVPVKGDITVYVADQSNADADVTAEVAKDMTNGKDGKILLNSDLDTTADIVVAVDAGHALYAGTLHYTFGECTGVGTSVVMTIGSTETLVNNEIVSIDAAPYVKADRTYVPLRALAQDFGAKVNWDEETNDITVEANGQTIILKADETTYTVNGEEKTMDVAPELDTEANRVLVPVRFVAEALGYNVTALYAADGTTSSVYFTM